MPVPIFLRGGGVSLSGGVPIRMGICQEGASLGAVSVKGVSVKDVEDLCEGGFCERGRRSL